MKVFWILLYQIAVCLAVSSVEYLCGLQTISLNERLGKSPPSYKFTTVVTDWVSQSTSYADQVKDGELLNTFVSDRNGMEIKYIQKSVDQATVVNVTGSHCGVTKEYNAFPTLSKDVRSIIGFNGSSLSDLLERVVNFSENNKGDYVNRTYSLVTTGVEAVQWVSCANTSTGIYQVEVVFADKSFQPPSPDFVNPLILYLRFSEFSLDKNTTASTSIEILKREKVSEQDNWYSKVPDSLACDGMPNTTLPSFFPEDASYGIKFTNNSLTTDLVFSHLKSANKVSITQDSFTVDAEVPLFGYKMSVPGAREIIHDFNSGYEYILSDRRCLDTKAIPESSKDVNKSNVFVLKNVNDIFFSDSLKWGFYQTEIIDNKTLSVFKAVDENKLFVLRGSNESVYDIRVFDLALRNLLTSYQFTNTTHMPVSFSQISDCFALSTGFPFMFNITAKSLQDVHGLGKEEITKALVNSLSQVAVINPYRIELIFNHLGDGVLQAIVWLNEKSASPPSPTGSFNYTNEVSSLDFVTAFNATLQKGDFKFKVFDKDCAVNAGSLYRFPPNKSSKDPVFFGYSGGSMFVLGLFSLILGCGIGAGGVFFVSRRQRITNLAYQVFE